MDPIMASIIMFGGSFAPRGWALCYGQLLSIAQNSALFSILGTTFGGNGQTTFALPDLRGRYPRGTGQGPGLGNVSLGQITGTESTTLVITNMPAHNHTADITHLTSIPAASAADGTTNAPSNAVVPAILPTIGTPPSATPINGYAPSDNVTTLGAGKVGGSLTIGISGGNQPFSIMNPYLGMTYIIAIEGVYPSRN